MNHLTLLFAFSTPIHVTDLYDKAAVSCKGYVEDSNYETDHCELGRGHRRKRKVRHLDSDSDDGSDSEMQSSTAKKPRTYLINKNLLKSKRTVPPPVPFSAPEKLVISSQDLVRQHTPQLEKQSPKKINIYTYSRKSNKNQVTKRIFDMKKKMQEEKDKKTGLSEKLRQLLSNKKLQKPYQDKATVF